MQTYANKIIQARAQYGITDKNTYNMDEKGFRQGVADRSKVIWKCLSKGRNGKVAANSNRELITVVEAISGDGMVLSLLVIYKGVPNKV